MDVPDPVSSRELAPDNLSDPFIMGALHFSRSLGGKAKEAPQLMGKDSGVSAGKCLRTGYGARG